MPDDASRIFAVTPCWDAAAYTPACARILDYIRAGDIYQANLTFPMHARWEGTPLGLHAALLRRQPVPHGAVVQLPDAPADGLALARTVLCDGCRGPDRDAADEGHRPARRLTPPATLPCATRLAAARRTAPRT